VNSFLIVFNSIAEEKRMNSRVTKYMIRGLVLAAAAMLPVAMVAQDSAKPATKAAAGDSPSKWDIFAGYSYLVPNGSADGYSYKDINAGAIGSVSRFFNKYYGVQVEGDFHNDGNEDQIHSDLSTNADFAGASVGLIARYPTSDLTPFVHALVGAENVGSTYEKNKWGVGVTAGGGLDYNTPLFNHHLGIRLFQMDYQYNHEKFDVSVPGDFNMLRLSTGIVYHIGSITPPPPVTLACSASPAQVFPGDPVSVTATAGSLDPKLNTVYSWSGEGVTGNGSTASVATASLAPGVHTVKCAVKEGKPGKEGLKAGQSADSTATFTVKAYEPPTVSCVASPSTIKPGETSTITATGLSPQNRPLTYSYSATAGSVSGSGTTASFNSTGAPTGAAGITCNVSDDKGQTATASTSVTVVAPYVAPAPHTQALCSITFEKDAKRPTRVDNEAKACLDQVALSLQKQSDAKAVVVGASNAKEKEKAAKAAKLEAKKKHPKEIVDPAAERAVNTKDYLVKEKGIDASRVSTATSATDGQKVEDYLVPAGASFTADVQGTTPVNETSVKPVVRKPLPVKKHHTKKAQ